MTQLNHRFNHEVENIALSGIRAFDEFCSKIDGIIKLTLGEPDFNTPEHVKQAGIKAIEDNFTRYTPASGIESLRVAASDWIADLYQLNYTPDEVIITHGATEGLITAFQTILNAGDKVIIPSPFFSLYQSMIEMNGGIPVLIDTSSNQFVLSPEMLQAALDEHGDDIKAVILNYPTNPTGITWSEEDAIAIANILKNYPIFVISDEVYSESIHEGKHVSIATYLHDQTIIVQSVSKSHAMTGWRVGFNFAPQYITDQMNKAHQNFITNVSSISQMAALEAITNGRHDAKPMTQTYRKRRDYIYERMTRMGFDIIKPNGAFYIFAKIPQGYEQDSAKFVLQLAEEARVAVIPGRAFGIGGENYIRISYAASDEVIEEAMNRLEAFLEKNQPK